MTEGPIWILRLAELGIPMKTDTGYSIAGKTNEIDPHLLYENRKTVSRAVAKQKWRLGCRAR